MLDPGPNPRRQSPFINGEYEKVESFEYRENGNYPELRDSRRKPSNSGSDFGRTQVQTLASAFGGLVFVSVCTKWICFQSLKNPFSSI